MIKFGKELKNIKKNIMGVLAKDDCRKKVIATGLWLLLMSSIRVGNTKYLKENGIGSKISQKIFLDVEK